MLAEHFGTIKSLHVGLVLGSGSLFAFRGICQLSNRWTRAQPTLNRLSYVIDTGLLAAALTLVALLRLNPLETPWLAAKLALLPVYVVLGSLALKRARTLTGRRAAFVAALGCFGLMYWIARTHRAMPWTVL